MNSPTNHRYRYGGGVALILAQALLFAVNLKVWAQNKINYAFIFEFDARHTMNYRQFLEVRFLFNLNIMFCYTYPTLDTSSPQLIVCNLFLV